MAATLTRVDYDLRVDPGAGDSISGRALMTIDVLREGWVTVPIPAGLRVRDARIDGQPVALIEGPPALVRLRRKARVVAVNPALCFDRCASPAVRAHSMKLR